MEAVVTGGLSLAFKLMVNKLRDQSSQHLRHRDVSDQKFREFIIRELFEIKEKLQGLCKRDLTAAAGYFKEGVELLVQHISGMQPELAFEQEVLQSRRNRGQDLAGLSASSVHSTTSRQRSKQDDEDEQFIVLHLLTEGRKAIELNPKDPLLAAAKNKFLFASDRAHSAFSNEALDAYDRALAMKIKVAATILQNLDQPEVPVVLSRGFLEQLNGVKEVSVAFTVKYGHFTVRKLFCELRRDALLSTVVLIHRILWEFTHICANSNDDNLRDKANNLLRSWPLVITDNRRQKIHPVMEDQVSQPYHSFLGEQGEDERHINNPIDLATTGKGEFVVVESMGKIKLFDETGNYKDTIFNIGFCKANSDELGGVSIVSLLHPQNIAVDCSNNVYACNSYRERGSSNYVNEIIAIDSNGEFLWSYGRDKNVTNFTRGKLRSIAVDNPRNRILALCKNTVYVFSIEGRYLSRFTPSNENDFKLGVDSNICVTDEGLVLVTGEDRVYVLFMFDRFGRVKESLKLSSKAGGEFSPSGIAYNHCTQEILIADKGTNCLLVCARDKTRDRFRFIRKIKFAERYTGGGVAVMRNGHIAVVNRGTNKIIII